MARESQDIASEELLALLHRASEGERQNLSTILRGSGSQALSPATLVHEVGLAGGHGVANVLRGGTGIGYLEVLEDVVGELELSTLEERLGKFEGKHFRSDIEKVIHPPQDEVAKKFRRRHGLRTEPYSEFEINELRKAGNRYAEQCELKIINYILKTTYNKLDEAQRVAFDQELAKVASSLSADKDPSALTGTAGLMAIANLGGFATYTLMSSVLSTITFGTLGFGAYTAAASLLSVAIGPVGWLALGSVAAYKFGKPEMEKTIPFSATVGMIRQRIKAGRTPEQELKPTQNHPPAPIDSPMQYDPEPPRDSLITEQQAPIAKELSKESGKAQEPRSRVIRLNSDASSRVAATFVEFFEARSDLLNSTSDAENAMPKSLALPSPKELGAFLTRKFGSHNKWPEQHKMMYVLLINCTRKN